MTFVSTWLKYDVTVLKGGFKKQNALEFKVSVFLQGVVKEFQSPFQLVKSSESVML